MNLKQTRKTFEEQLFFGKKWANFNLAERFTLLTIASAPAMFLGVNHWIVNVSVLAAIGAVYSLFKMHRAVNLSEIPNFKVISSIFLIYILAIFVSQLGRQDFIFRPYLDQTRWLYGLPIFIYLFYARVNFAKVLDWVLPICILSSYVSSVFLMPSHDWGDRATVSFMDPLVFGYMNFTIALMCMASVAVDLYKFKFSINTAVKIAAFALGFYLSLRSGSRSGWLAFPVILIVMAYYLYKPSLWQGIAIFFAVLLISISIYYASEIVKARIDLMILELRQYPWSGGVAQDSSVSVRVTFYKIGYYYFSQSPIFGWGEKGYIAIKDATELHSYSSQYARDFAFHALFHSEWTTQAVRFGVLGLFAVFWIFFVPFKLFIQFAKWGEELFGVAFMGLAYMICLLVASVGDEVFNDRMTVAFSAIVIAGLLATGMSIMEKRKVAN